MAMHTSYRYEVKSDPSKFSGEARVNARIESEAAMAEIVKQNIDLKRAIERTEWESKDSVGRVQAGIKAAGMDLVLARKALLMVRRDELKKLFSEEQEQYLAELAQQGLTMSKHRL